MQALLADDPSAIGGYELRARLGQGGFGLVYLGRSTAGRAVAVKVLQPHIAQDPDLMVRFRREVDAARRVSGLFTAPVVDAGLDDRPPWVVTAFVPGPALDQAVAAHRPFPEAALWRLLAGLVEALQAIHAAGIVHRDLKPGNVLLAADGPRVIDFGISKALEDTRLTLTGAVFGTPAYMSPEQAYGEEAGPSSDVFALGGVLTYAATGTAPFGDGPQHVVRARVVSGAPSLNAVPPPLRDTIARCLAKDPAQRPPLAELAAIGRDGPGGQAEWGSGFWPPDVAQLIRDHEHRSDAEEAGLVPASPPPFPPRGGTAFAPTQTAAPAPAPPATDPAGGRSVPVTPQAAPPPVASPPAAQPVYVQPPAPGQAPIGDLQWRSLPGTMKTAVVLMRVGTWVNLAVGLAEFFGDFFLSGTLIDLAAAALWLVALWALIIRKIRKGRNWARILGSAFFVLYAAWLGSVGVGMGFSSLYAALMLVPGLLSLAIVVLLWSRPTNHFFRSVR